MKAKMKGQISFDYYVSLIIFVFFAVYFLFQITNLVPNFVGLMEEQRIRSEAYQISELLINDVGNPNDWDSLVPGSESSINRIGMSDETRNSTNLLAISKINDLESVCTTQGHEFLRSRMGTDLQFSVFVIDRTDDSVLLDCLPPNVNTTTGEPFLRGFSVSASRIVAFDDGNYGELRLQVWKQ